MEATVIQNTLKMNETLKTIYERRAVRTYLDKPVSKELIEQLLDAGRMAPSAINKQPWKFYVVTKKETIKLFSDEIGKVAASHYHLAFASGLLKMTEAIFHGAPVVIFITAPRTNEWAPIDIGMCAQNIMLAAKSLGLDTCPVGMGKFIEETKSFSKLKVSDKEKVILSITAGFGKKIPDVHSREKKNVTYID
jgi:nitroreductase